MVEQARFLLYKLSPPQEGLISHLATSHEESKEKDEEGNGKKGWVLTDRNAVVFG